MYFRYLIPAFLGIFIFIFSWQNMPLWTHIATQNTQYFSPESQFNAALQLAKKGQYTAAFNTISPLTTSTSCNCMDRVFELMGDIQYSMHSNKKQVIGWYQKSYDIQKHPRVAKKIGLLRDTLPIQKIGKMSQKGSNDEIRKTQQRIKQEQEQRGKYLQGDQSSEFDATFQSLSQMFDKNGTNTNTKNW